MIILQVVVGRGRLGIQGMHYLALGDTIDTPGCAPSPLLKD